MYGRFGDVFSAYFSPIIDSDPSPARVREYASLAISRRIFRYQVQIEIMSSPAQAQPGQMVLPGFESLMGFSVVS